MDPIENDTSNNSFIVACVFIAKITFLRDRCLATVGGLHIETHRLMGGIYEVGRWDGIYIPVFIKIGSAITKLVRGNS
jgi:hypothetical protein